MKKVCVLGEGAWGTAIALLLADNGYEVLLWCHDKMIAEEINTSRLNNYYLPGFVLNERITPVTQLSALQEVEFIFETIPVKYLRTVVSAAKAYLTPKHVWVVLSKGIENETLLLPSQIIEEICGPSHLVVVSGPSFAIEVAQKKVTAVTVASRNIAHAQAVQLFLKNNYFSPFIGTDIIGAQIGGALKNAISIGLGIAEGTGEAENTKAFLLTCGLEEMALLTEAYGGKKSTIYGLSGVGDLVMAIRSATLSRNFLIGKKMGAGATLQQLQDSMSVLPEGMNTIKSLYQMVQQKKLVLPFCTGIYHVVYQEKRISDVIANLHAAVL